MRVFHVSEEPNISQFIPRIPDRNDLDKSKGLVWALSEKCLPNFLTLRDCPRVAYHASNQTTQEDIDKFFSSSSRHCLAIENIWFERMTKANIYIYEFDVTNFYLLDECAGYYVSEQVERPISMRRVDNLFGELFIRDVKIRFLNNLWDLGDAVKESTLNWSLCRMRNAKPKL